MITLEQTARAMTELIQPGTPNGKLAYWNACLSKHTFFNVNCRQALVMRNYAYKPLPDREVLRVQLGGLLNTTLDTLYAIEKLWNSGLIHFNCGDTYQSQYIWREKMISLIPGMSYKTVSWALQLYSIDTCQLMAIDTWHVQRLHACYGKVREGNYVKYEKRLLDDCRQLAIEEASSYPVTIYAACLWGRAREASGIIPAMPSHKDLSCYVPSVASLLFPSMFQALNDALAS